MKVFNYLSLQVGSNIFQSPLKIGCYYLLDLKMNFKKE